jgi:hypothetical protein
MSSFPAGQQGHGKKDEKDTVVLTIPLHRLRAGTTAYPSIALRERDGYDVRASSNGDWVYFWNGEELKALELNAVVEHLKRYCTSPAVPSAVVRHVVTKRRQRNRS